MRVAWLLGPLVAALAWAGCGSDPDPELPAGWQGAEPIAELTQSACEGSALDPAVHEALSLTASAGRIELAYQHAHFRCQQKVEGFLRRKGSALDVLVQPVDMNPSAVARCDCLYDISLRIAASRGAQAVTLWRRWDNINRPNEPVEVDSQTIDVPAK